MRLLDGLQYLWDFFVFVAKKWWNFPHGRPIESI